MEPVWPGGPRAAACTGVALRPQAVAYVVHALSRTALAAALLAPLSAEAREWLFDVTLDGLSIGTHRFVLTDAGEERRVTSDAHFRVRLLLIDAYSYDHHADEVWRGDCLSTLASSTVERGKVTTVTGRQEEEGFVVESPRGRESAGGCAMTFAYWNPRVVQQRALVNAQTGVSTPVTTKPTGRA